MTKEQILEAITEIKVHEWRDGKPWIVGARELSFEKLSAFLAEHLEEKVVDEGV